MVDYSGMANLQPYRRDRRKPWFVLALVISAVGFSWLVADIVDAPPNVSRLECGPQTMTASQVQQMRANGRFQCLESLLP